MTQLEHWGCPWSRKDDGHVNVRFFGGMKVQRTWFAADKTGFHMLHTLFQTSHEVPVDQALRRVLLRRPDRRGRPRAGRARDRDRDRRVLASSECKAVIICTGGAGRVFGQNTNAGIVTGDGMGIAFRHGVPLRDMEFVQWHPTALPGHRRADHRRLPRRRRHPHQQGRLPLSPGLRPGPARSVAAPEGDGARPARPPVAGVLARGAEGPHGGARRWATPCCSTCATWARRRSTSGCRSSPRSPRPSSASTRSCRRFRCGPAVHYTMGGILCNGRTETPLAGALRRGRMLERRHPRRQPPRLQLARRRSSCSARWRASAPREYAQAARPAERRCGAQAGGGRRSAAARHARASDKGERVATIRDEMHDGDGDGVGIFRKADGDAGGVREARRAARALSPRPQARRPQPRLQHRVAVGDRARIHARDRRGDRALGATAQGIARRAHPARRVQGARRRELPQAHARVTAPATARRASTTRR